MADNWAKRLADKEREFFQKEKDKILFVQQSMKQSEGLVDNMMTILTHFEDSLTGLEKSMLPIHQKTQGLTAAQKNIDLALAECDKVIAHYKMSTETDEELEARDITSDYKGYLDWVESVNAAQMYFTQNASFKGSDRILKNLKDLTKRAMNDCEKEFERLLSQSSKPVDLSKTTWPLPHNYELLPSTIVGRLARIAERMQACDYHSHVKILQERRSANLRASLKKVFGDGFNPYGQVEEKATELSVGRYRKGTHPTIFHLQFLLKLLELESELFTQLLQLTGLSANETAKAFSAMAFEPLEYFQKKVEAVVRDKGPPGRVLMFLDILENLNALLPRFRAVLVKKEEMDRIASLKQEITTAVQSGFVEYRDYLLEHKEVKRKAKQRDGTISSITVETLAFLRRLLEFQTTIESMNDSKTASPAEDDRSGRAKLMMHYNMLLLRALEKNLEQQAKTYKGALSAIFLLNNFHYILKHVRDRILVEPDFLARYEKLVKQSIAEYRSSTWDKALEYLDPTERDELWRKAKAADPSQPLSSSLKKAIKAKFKGFNQLFEELHTTQRTFSVPDPDLRSQLRTGNVELILEKYKEFFAKFTQIHFTDKKNRYFRYPPRILESMLNKFFDEEA